MSQVVTNAGEALFAQKAQENEQLDIDTFIFAYVPGQDSQAPVDRNEGLPPTAQQVHTQPVQQVGRINNNTVVYSTVLNSLTGPFEFNWVGLYSSVNNTLVAISHVKSVNKTITELGNAGNTLNRNFAIEYSGISDITGITVGPETWQLDFSARLAGMDAVTQNLAMDMNGRDWFIDDGFKVEPTANDDEFRVIAGVGYVAGMRVELEQDFVFSVQSYPQNVYVDVWFESDSSSHWKAQVVFTLSNNEMDDYINVNGLQHYVFQLARVTNVGFVEDLRSLKGLNEKIKNAEFSLEKIEADLINNDKNALKNIYSSLVSDRFNYARNICAVGRSYIWRNPIRFSNEDYLFSVGSNQGGGTSEWDFVKDADGFYRIRYGYVGAIRKPSLGVNASNFSRQPEVSSNNAHFRESDGLNSTMEIAFNGRGLIFQSYIDDRGGAWSISVDDEEPIEVSVNSNNPKNDIDGSTIRVVIAEDLEKWPHIAKFKFIGADPLYPPSDGNARGWFKLNNIDTTPDQYTGLVITGNELGIADSEQAIVSNGVLEFAISAAPSESGFTPDWVPAHGNASNAIKIKNQKVFVNNKEIKNLNEIKESEIYEVTIVQEYTAYNSFSGLTLPMWEGLLVSKYERVKGLSFTHEFTALRDLNVLDGYSAMVSGRRTEDLKRVQTDNGSKINLDSSIPEEQIAHFTNKIQSVVYEGEHNILAMKTNSPQASGNIGEKSVDENMSLITERSDGFVKTYIKQIGTNKQIKKDEMFTSSHSIWLGIKY